MSGYQFNPLEYPSLKRMVDPLTGNFVDQWMTESGFHLMLPDDRAVFVAPGFAFDKASVPSILHGYLNRDDSHVIVAALVHDFLYENQRIEGKWIQRKEADEIFHGIIKQSKMRPTKAWVAYMGVRLFGWRFFNKTARVLKNPYYV